MKTLEEIKKVLVEHKRIGKKGRLYMLTNSVTLFCCHSVGKGTAFGLGNTR